MRTLEEDIFGGGTGRKKVNSKKKGDNNERVAAKCLEKWTGQKFTRVPSSGGLRWQKTANVCGDLVCENEDFDFPFAVETKHLSSLTISLKLRANSRVFSIYDQSKEDADRAGKKPLMMLRRNGMKAGTYVFFFEFKLDIPHISKGTYGNVELFGYKSQDIINDVNFDELKKLL